MGIEDNCFSHARSVAEEMSAWLLEHGFGTDHTDGLKNVFRALATGPLRELPEPGRGDTASRFAALAKVAAHSLPLVKLYEAHTDALAILREFGSPLADEPFTWGVFAADAPEAELIASLVSDERVVLTGTKQWCSGADAVSHALVTAKTVSGEPLLVAVALDDGFCSVSQDDWQAVGMALTQTAKLTFSKSTGQIVARNNGYIERPGFWLGAIGVAACWYGALATLAQSLHDGLRKRHDAHGLAHLGACAASLQAARSALMMASLQIDAEGDQNQQALALATRAIVEDSCNNVLSHVGRALGARPFCFDGEFARRAADLPVYLRQSHAERDLANLGSTLLSRSRSWTDLHQSL
jgi:alkylation response protein AidB-like acyl-CoA dehydrogenase